MPLNRDEYKWADVDEVENGLPNKQNPAPEIKNSGLKANQPEPRGWYNWQMHKLGEGLNLIEDEYIAADNALQANIDAEKNARINADNSLQEDIEQEISDRENADTGLQNQINDLTLSIMQAVYPVGSYYTSSVSTNPNTLFGFGSWSRVEGRFIVGLDEGDTAFDLAGEQGGSKTHTHTASTSTTTTTTTTVDDHVLTEAEIPSHAHRLYGTDTSSASVEPLNGATVAGDTNGSGIYTNSGLGGNQLVEDTGGDQGHNHTASSTSSSTSNTTVDSSSNLPPYEVAYIWKRTA